MKLTLTTVYEGFDQAWLDFYLNELENSGYPEQIRSANALRNGESYSWTDTDPTNPKVSGTTGYRLEK